MTEKNDYGREVVLLIKLIRNPYFVESSGNMNFVDVEQRTEWRTEVKELLQNFSLNGSGTEEL